MLPMLGREVEVSEEAILVDGQRRHGLGILGAVLLDEARDILFRRGARVGVHHLVQRLLGPRLQALRELVQHVGNPVDPAPLLPRLRPYLAHRRPEPQRAIADGQHRGPQPAALEIAQHRSPALRALAIAVLEGHDFLGAIRPHADQDQRTEPLLLEADGEVNPVRPQVDVVPVRQFPAPERLVLRRPRPGQAPDRAGRQARRFRPQQRGQGLAEIPRRQAVQIEQGQHALHPRRAPHPGRQDRAREFLAPAGHHAPIVHAGRRDRHRPHPRQHRAWPRAPVAHHQGVAGGVPLAPVPRQILVDLQLQGGGDHALCPHPRQLIERRLAQPRLRLVRLRSDKLQHRWRTFLPGWHRGLRGCPATSPEGYVASLPHPQLSTIAPRRAWPRSSWKSPGG
jgi:hypothetical protein